MCVWGGGGGGEGKGEGGGGRGGGREQMLPLLYRFYCLLLIAVLLNEK